MPEVPTLPGRLIAGESRLSASGSAPAFVTHGGALVGRKQPRWAPSLRAARYVTHASRQSPILVSLIFLVLLPTFIAGNYFTFVASKLYTSEFRATVRSIEQSKAVSMTSLLGLAGASQSQNDANAVVQYVESRDALEELDKKTGLRGQYSSDSIDWASRFSDNQTIEAFVRFWRRHLDAFFEPTTGTIVVKVSSFTPESALAAARNVLSQSEELVNRLSTRALTDGVRFAEVHVTKAEQRLVEANQHLRLVQDQEKMLDPQKAAASTAALVTKLREQLSSLNATLSVNQSYLNSDSPVVKIAQKQVLALRQQIDTLNATQTADQNAPGKTLSSVLGTFDQVESERIFSEKNYQSALAALEAARIEATRQQVYLATIVRPELPQEAVYPRPLINTATTGGIALILWAVGLLSVYAVREHM